MISGPDTAATRRGRREILAGVLALALGPRTATGDPGIAAPGWGLDELMATLRQVRGGSARFVEWKYLQVMTAPLRASGVLRYVAPDRLEKRTFYPQPSLLVIAGDVLTVERQGAATRIIAMQDYPEIAGLVAGVRATMAGDLATLNRFYALVLHGDATNWQLHLEPRDRRMRALVASIRITGRGNVLVRVETEESDGDRTEMIIDADAP